MPYIIAALVIAMVLTAMLWRCAHVGKRADKQVEEYNNEQESTGQAGY